MSQHNHSSRDRKHPHRFSCDIYQIPHHVVFVTFRSDPAYNLAQTAVMNTLCEAMGRIGQRRDTIVHAYCVMPDHIHVVVSAGPDGDIAQWIRFTKREATRALGKPGIWQRSYWDRHAREREELVDMVRYVLNNPVRAGLSDTFEQWPYSWSRWHQGTGGPNPNVGE